MGIKKIDIGTPKVEFDIGGVIIKADATEKAMAEIVRRRDDEKAKEKMKKIENIKNVSDEDVTGELFDDMIDTVIDVYNFVFAPVFGETAFKNVYEVAGSIQVTIGAFDEALDYITDQYLENQNKQTNKYRKRKK